MRGVGDDQPGGLALAGLVASVARWPEDAARVVTAPVVAAVCAEEDVLAAAAVLVRAGAGLRWLARELIGEEVGEVDG